MSPTPLNPLGVGLHDKIPAAQYHADPCVTPSLSSGVARELIENTPAHAYLKHVRLGGHITEPTSEMVLGSAVHAMAADEFGTDGGDEFEIGLFDNYTTKVAREWRDGVAAAGKTPILEKTVDRANAINKALRAKAAIGLTADPFTAGKPEVTAIWQEDGFWFRARYDRLILDPTFFGDVWDWKTTSGGVSPDALERIIIDKGYHIQAAHYLRGLNALVPEYRGRLSFILTFVETEAPYAVRRVPISEGFLAIGNMLLNRAIARWTDCLAKSHWPDDSGESVMLTPPTWYLKKIEEAAA